MKDGRVGKGLRREAEGPDLETDRRTRALDTKAAVVPRAVACYHYQTILYEASYKKNHVGLI